MERLGQLPAEEDEVRQAALESDDFDLRLAAIEELSLALAENYGYFADSPPEERAPAVDRWRAALAARPELEV